MKKLRTKAAALFLLAALLLTSIPASLAALTPVEAGGAADIIGNAEGINSDYIIANAENLAADYESAAVAIAGELEAMAADLQAMAVADLTPQYGPNGKFLAPIDAPDPNAIEIYNRADLAKIGVDAWYPANGSYRLMNDIDLRDADWTPLGNFSGTFDGQGYVISNMRITGSREYSGLFSNIVSNANIGDNGVVKNLGLENTYIEVSIASWLYTGGICGHSSGAISNCYNTGTINVSASNGVYAGGIGGRTYGLISNCYNTGAITAYSSGGAHTGGITATNVGTISDCYNTGDISHNGGNASIGGGISGDADTVTGCYNTGTVTSVSPIRNDYAAGISGMADTITDCHNAGSVISDAHAAGIGFHANISNCHNEGSVTAVHEASGIGSGGDGDSISNCYNTGSISSASTSTTASASGIGEGPTIIDCYNTGAVTASGTGSYAGGIGAWQRGTISYSYNTGHVSASSSTSFALVCAGGISGNSPYYSPSSSSSPIISNCVVLAREITAVNTASPASIACNLIGAGSSKFGNLAVEGIRGNATDDTGTGSGGSRLTLAAAQTQAAYPSGWDFVSDWQMVGGYSFPQLQWQTEYTEGWNPLEVTADFTDPDFLAAVRTALGLSGSDPVYDSVAAALTVLDVSSSNIASLAGLEHFTALQRLDCSDNRLAALDVSHNTALAYLWVDHNYLPNVSAITGLTLSTDEGLTDGTDPYFRYTPQNTTGFTLDQTDAVYGQILPDPSVGAGAPIGALTYSYSGVLGSGAAYGPTAVKPAEVGQYSVTGTDTASYTDTAPFAITRKPLTLTGLTVIPKVYDGNTTAALGGTPVLTGKVGTDDVSVNLSAAQAVFDSPAAGDNKPVAVTGLALAGTKAANYTLDSSLTLTGEIRLPDPFTLTQAGITYGQTLGNPRVTGANASELTYTYAGTLRNGAGSYGPDPAKPTEAGDYTLTAVAPSGLTVTADFTIAPKALTISGLTVTTKTYDRTVSAALAGTPVLTGKVGTDDVSVDLGAAAAVFDSPAVGKNKTVSVTGLALTG
ncbi:MAG: YDG domain-containing protein, partial [Gracilibacteraceae bacterium]|nr:YDG domain-containing protein [Gracilibacteraceae bacterium]